MMSKVLTTFARFFITMVGVSPTHCSLCAEDLRKCLAHFVFNRPTIEHPYNPTD